MRRAIKAGVAYFGVVFGLGFLLGAVRILALVPWFGPVGAVAVEIPVMLGASWLACGWAVRLFAVPSAWQDRLAMGAIAFGCLMVAELTVSMIAFGRSMAEHLAIYREIDALIGLAAQLVFAGFPLIRAIPHDLNHT
ncbi:hypothetical protein [Microvirga sp. M2]|uniref:hypothetical protein n=1 Tax=Microvirga sp. M2 TaxID=3073270 RepID=UPI0039C1B194